MNSKNNKLSSKVGTKIRLERTKRGLSQEKLASLANLNVNSVGAIERGVSSPSLETLEQIANALEMPLLELINTDKVDL